jgi:hypothetical protein
LFENRIEIKAWNKLNVRKNSTKLLMMKQYSVDIYNCYIVYLL